jgi:hypothetical protein
MGPGSIIALVLIAPFIVAGLIVLVRIIFK